MGFDFNKPDLMVGVVGTGTMGRGIAQIAAAAGCQVWLLDAKPGAALAAHEAIAGTLQGQVAKGKLKEADANRTLSAIALAESVSDLKDCDIVVEAIVEDLQVKRDLFRSLEEVIREDAVLATNTSSLSVTAVAAGCDQPERVAGWHFFNPVPLMKLAEVIDGISTAPWVTEGLMALTVRMGHTPVRAKDMPGFIVNHAGRAYIPEALRMLSEGIAEFYEIDRIMRDCAGFRMGPFELIDLIGLDVGKMVFESLYHQYYEEPRFKPTPLVAQRVSAGLFGRKNKRGFYDYTQGDAAQITEPQVPLLQQRSVWVSNAEPELAQKVREVLVKCNATLENGREPTSDALIIVTPVGADTTTICSQLGLDPVRTVAVNALFSMEKRRELMCSPATSPAYRDAAHAMFAVDGAAVTVLRDSPGFVSQRMVAQIVSIGCDIAQQRIATPRDIDLAVRLALGYPKGPFELGDSIGPSRMLSIGEQLVRAYDDPRYRTSIWLRRRAIQGLSLLHQD